MSTLTTYIAETVEMILKQRIEEYLDLKKETGEDETADKDVPKDYEE
jgi:hypothetical protein